MVCSDILSYQSVKLLIVYSSTVGKECFFGKFLIVRIVIIQNFPSENITSDCIFWMQSFYTLNSAIWWKYLYCCTYALYMQRVSFFVCYHEREKLVYLNISYWRKPLRHLTKDITSQMCQSKSAEQPSAQLVYLELK